MAMFVLVVDTSLMNVSIAAVVRDLDTTVSGVQSAIALEALVSAAFILIGSKVGDLFGRKRAYVLGLLAYAVGALAMAFAQGLTAIIVFWAVVGGLGASLLLPAMQSLVHGNFEGAAQRKAYALVGAAAAIAAAVGPLIGGFITTYLSWRVGFLLEVVIIAIVLSGIKLVHDVPYTGTEADRSRRRGPLRVRHGRPRAGHPRLAGGRRVRRRAARDRRARARGARLLARAAQARGEADPDRSRICSARSSSGSASPGRCCSRSRSAALMIALPIYLQMVLEYYAMEAGLSLAPLSLSMFGVALLAGRKGGSPTPQHASSASASRSSAWERCSSSRSSPERIPAGISSSRSLIAGSGLGLLVSQLNNYTLAPIEEERASEAAGVNSAAGSFGLSFGLAFAGAIMLATLSLTFTSKAEDSAVLSPAEQEQVARTLEDDAQVMTNTQLDQLLAGQPEDVQDEIIRINTDARPIALQVALAIPILAALVGLLNSFRMMRLPDPAPSSAAAEMAFG